MDNDSTITCSLPEHMTIMHIARIYLVVLIIRSLCV